MDSTRRLIIIVVIGVIVIVGVISIRSWVAEAPVEEAPVVVQPKILIAKRDIPPATIVQPATDIDWQSIAAEEVKEEYLKEGTVHLEDYMGAITRRQLRTGDPVTAESLTKAGEGGFMSAVLEPGMRAVSIAVTAISGNAGFISPGDRVDLIVTHRVRGASSDSDGSVVSETFVRNVRVIAVDQQLDNPENKAILAKTVTIEVTPHQAEQIAVASDLGKLSLVLRGVAGDTAGEAQTAETGTFTRDTDISGALSGGGISSTIRIIRGDQVETLSLQ